MLMRSSKVSTLFLLLLMLFTLTMSVGCGKENEKDNDDKDNGSEVVGNEEQDKDDEKDPTATDTNNNDDKTEEKKTVKLLKRNGVEWKENTSIDSYRGAEKYTVVWGDTLSLVARTWKVNCYTLARYNGIENIDLIEVGQVIYNYTYKG